ncbi:MAG TPA: hypothetical protein VIU62_13040 [Chloroflexota bacterium]
MARLCTAVIVTGILALVWAAHSPSFNADLSSPALLKSLTADYMAVDAIYGGVTSPYTVDAVLHRQDPPPPSMGFVSRPPGLMIAKAADGERYAQQAEGAVAALGATAELVPVRRELLESYRDVEYAWRMERLVEQASATDSTAAPLTVLGPVPSALSAANSSIATMQQARALHDQAIAAVQVLSGKPPSAATADAASGQPAYRYPGDRAGP